MILTTIGLVVTVIYLLLRLRSLERRVDRLSDMRSGIIVGSKYGIHPRERAD